MGSVRLKICLSFVWFYFIRIQYKDTKVLRTFFILYSTDNINLEKCSVFGDDRQQISCIMHRFNQRFKPVVLAVNFSLSPWRWALYQSRNVGSSGVLHEIFYLPEPRISSKYSKLIYLLSILYTYCQLIKLKFS